MKVTLVGTNVELEPLRTALCDNALLSPEPIAAAYARISRSLESVRELRQSARADVESARRSNQRIVFDMGHSSIAEHAVFNFDIEGLSRLAIEELERSRLASFTERSQRYVLLDSSCHVPQEACRDESVKAAFVARFDALYEAYKTLHTRLLARQLHDVGGSVSKGQRQSMETAAREDARYVLPLAALGQLGMTVNARTLEGMARRLRGHDLAEMRDLALLLEQQALAVAPSLIRHTAPRDLGDVSAHWELARAPFGNSPLTARFDTSTRLVQATPGADDVLADTLAWVEGGQPSLQRLEGWLAAYYGKAMAYDAAPRLLEYAEFTFEAVVSAACFGQLKRHRLASLLAGPYDPGLGIRIPPSVVAADLQEVLLQAAPLSDALRQAPVKPVSLMAYAWTNGHCRKVLMKLNLRELYHFCRLRMDAHAQWEIRQLASDMARSAMDVAPVSAGYLCGKDEFAAKRG